MTFTNIHLDLIPFIASVTMHTTEKWRHGTGNWKLVRKQVACKFE